MLELTQEQSHAVGQAEMPPATLIDPITRTAYVLLLAEDYDRLMEAYDDGPWTAEEMDLLAVEAGDLLDSFLERAGSVSDG